MACVIGGVSGFPITPSITAIVGAGLVPALGSARGVQNKVCLLLIFLLGSNNSVYYGFFGWRWIGAATSLPQSIVPYSTCHIQRVQHFQFLQSKTVFDPHFRYYSGSYQRVPRLVPLLPSLKSVYFPFDRTLGVSSLLLQNTYEEK